MFNVALVVYDNVVYEGTSPETDVFVASLDTKQHILSKLPSATTCTSCCL